MLYLFLNLRLGYFRELNLYSSSWKYSIRTHTDTHLAKLHGQLLYLLMWNHLMFLDMIHWLLFSITILHSCTLSSAFKPFVPLHMCIEGYFSSIGRVKGYSHQETLRLLLSNEWFASMFSLNSKVSRIRKFINWQIIKGV